MYKRSLNEKQRTIKDLIKEKDYDYVSYMITIVTISGYPIKKSLMKFKNGI